jgi:hypothetical protein
MLQFDLIPNNILVLFGELQEKAESFNCVMKLGVLVPG